MIKRRSAKRRWASRSKSRPARRTATGRSFPKRTVAVASRSVGLGLSATTVLRTSFFYNATAVVGTGVYNGYLKTGSCFDPCGDLAAIQPHLFDQWAAIYNRYKVNSVVVRMKITGGDSGTSSTPVWVGCIYPCVDPTALATYQAAASQQYAKTTSGCFTVGGVTGFGSEGKYLSLKFREDSVTGVKTADTYDGGALVSADPTPLQYSVVPIFLQANAAGGTKWIIEVDIWQNVTFSNKKNVVDA